MAGMKRDAKKARPVRPNAGVEAAYRRALSSMARQMAESTIYWLEAAYKANPPRMAADAAPSQEVGRRIEELWRRWSIKFNDMAERVAERFVRSSQMSAENAFRQALKDAGWSVEFRTTPVMRDAMAAAVAENVALIRSIPEQYFQQVQGVVMRGFTNGRDLKAISDELQQRYAVTSRRAALIARDQSNKLTAITTRARRIELGLYEAEWVHSGGGKEPRHSHAMAGKQRKRFDVREGCLIDGEYIQPGELINCRCTSKTILPFS